MTAPVITLDDVGKRYVKYDDAPLLLSRVVRVRRGNRRSALWALRHVDLEVARGEAVGVIGRNGAGKSTMLRLLAGITAPSEGRVAVGGLVAPLIAVGVGFHPELSGRENVYVNGTVLGMPRPEIDRRLEQIVDFAELDDFIDTPVKFYSSGMFVRLGFSVAVAARPDVLLVDEVLAVGDIGFQMRCFDRMRELQVEGTTMIVVSHNLNAVRNMCDRVLVVRRGEPVFLGDPEAAISAYYDDAPDARDGTAGTARRRPSTSPVTVTAPELLDGDGRATAHLTAGDEVTVRAEIVATAPVERPIVGLVLTSAAGVPVYTDSTYDDAPVPPLTPGDRRRCAIRFPARLPTGAYSVRVVVHHGQHGDEHTSSPARTFHVTGRHMVSGVADLGATFEVDEPD